MQLGPRVMAGTPSHPLQKVAAMAFAFPGAGDQAGDGGLFFVGAVAVAIALPALLSRRSVPMAILALFAGWMATGYPTRPSPFSLLRELPMFEVLRYPERFLFPFALYLAVLAAVGVGVLQTLTRGARRWSAWASRAVVVAVVASAAGWGMQIAAMDRLARRSSLVTTPERGTAAFAQARGNRWLQGHLLALNRGSLSCGEGYPVPMSPLLRGDLPQEERFEDPASGAVVRKRWSPHRIDLDVEARSAATILVNQNWNRAWGSSVGTVRSREGLLAVDVPPGSYQLTLRYVPHSVIAGAVASLVTLAVFALLAWRRRSLLHPEAWVFALLPLAAGGVAIALSAQPLGGPVLTNANGAPLVVERLPEGVIPLDARLGPSIELLAASVPSAPDPEGEVPLELYWRIRGPVPKTIGIFVHILGPEGKRKSADHPVIGGTWFFKRAPREVLLRDAFAVNTHDWEAGEWTVTVGLWHASGDGSRVPMTTAGGAPVPDSRLEVGSFTVPAKTDTPRSPVEEPSKP